MRWEQVPDLPLFADNTAAFIHQIDPAAISNVNGESNYSAGADLGSAHRVA
jgi:hypothetical protein